MLIPVPRVFDPALTSLTALRSMRLSTRLPANYTQAVFGVRFYACVRRSPMDRGRRSAADAAAQNDSSTQVAKEIDEAETALTRRQ